MKRIAAFALPLVFAIGTSGASGQTAALESFRGSVKAVSGSSITVERSTMTGTFTIDAKTHVAARGATAKTKANVAAGKPGLTVPDAVHAGDQVVVRYREVNGALIAADIQVRSPGSLSK